MTSRYLILSFALCVFAGALAIAQNTAATVAGTVADQQGQSLPGAQVVLTNVATNVPVETKTNGDGIYRITGLLPGSYRAVVTKEGFRQTVKEGIELHVDDQVSMNFSLQIGVVSETLNVEAGVSTIEAESSTVGQVVESRSIQDQPLNGRNVYSLEALAPGVIAQGGTGQQAAMSQIWANNNYQIGGGFGNQSSTFVDGAPINVNYANGSALTPTQDSIQEFKIETNNVGAEFGATGGGIINMVTRSGGDAFHGTAYEFLRNKVLDANTFFSDQAGLAKPAFTQNQYGVSVGGPIVKQKTFFFFSWENFALRQGATNLASLPTAAERAGDFSAAGLPPIYDPCAGNVTAENTCASVPAQRTQFPGNIIPASRLDPTAVAIMNAYWPLPNASGVNNFVTTYNIREDSQQYTGRIDENISAKQRLFGRYTYSHGQQGPIVPLGTPYVGTGFGPAVVHQLVIGDNYTLSPTTVAEMRISFLRFAWAHYSPSPSIDATKFAWPAAFTTEMASDGVLGCPDVGIAGISGGSGSSFVEATGGCDGLLIAHNTNYSIGGSITKEIGRHTLKFGGEAERLDDNYGQGGGTAGGYSFTPGMTSIDPANPGSTGLGFASFLLGYGSSGSVTVQFIPAATQYYQGYYVNDQFKFTRKLTLNLGLRWEQPGMYVTRHDYATVFLPNATSPLAAASGLPLRGKFALVNSPDWPDRHSQQLHWNLFAPRVGFAYRLTDKTAIRGGFGLFFPPSTYSLLLSPAFAPINAASTSWLTSLDGGITPYATLHNPYPQGINQPVERDPNFETPLYGGFAFSPVPVQPATRIYQWNFDVERELGRGVVLDVAYAGSRGTHLPSIIQSINSLPDSDLALGSQLLQSVPNPFFGLPEAGSTLGSEPTLIQAQLLLPYPQFAAADGIGINNRDSFYHSMQVKLQKRFGSGGTLLAAYTWAKLISNVDSLTGWSEGEAGLEGAQGDQDPNNLRGERSLSGNDVPHNLVVSYVLDLPFGKGQRWLGGVTGIANQLISGWSMEGVTNFQSGFPLGITNAIPAVFGGTRPNVVPGCHKSVSGSAVSRLGGWFNTACFSEPAAFSFGDEPREDPTLRAAGINNWNVGVGKRFALTERIGLTFRSEFFNLFNRVQFGPPGTAFGTPQFGVVSSQVNNPRQIQFGLRLSF